MAGCGPQRLGSPLKLKDACYHKVKAQYDVFPSAYASGAIAKCRKQRKEKVICIYKVTLPSKKSERLKKA